MENELPNHLVYSKNVIEFTTVAAETCLFLENASQMSKTDFVQKAVRILPLLYLKMLMIDVPDEEVEGFAERFVSEEEYADVQNSIATLLGTDDSFLDVFHPDMPYSDTPIVVFVSENLADLYQEIKDYAAAYSLGEEEVMNDALLVCIENFAEHWGQKLLNTLRALHNLRVIGEE